MEVIWQTKLKFYCKRILWLGQYFQPDVGNRIKNNSVTGEGQGSDEFAEVFSAKMGLRCPLMGRFIIMTSSAVEEPQVKHLELDSFSHSRETDRNVGKEIFQWLSGFRERFLVTPKVPMIYCCWRSEHANGVRLPYAYIFFDHFPPWLLPNLYIFCGKKYQHINYELCLAKNKDLYLNATFRTTDCLFNVNCLCGGLSLFWHPAPAQRTCCSCPIEMGKWRRSTATYTVTVRRLGSEHSKHKVLISWRSRSWEETEEQCNAGNFTQMAAVWVAGGGSTGCSDAKSLGVTGRGKTSSSQARQKHFPTKSNCVCKFPLLI